MGNRPVLSLCAEPPAEHFDHKVATACAYCSSTFDQSKIGLQRTKDHVIPRVLQIDCRGNVVAACRSCNQMKAAMLPDAIRIMAAAYDSHAQRLRNLADSIERVVEERGLPMPGLDAHMVEG